VRATPNTNPVILSAAEGSIIHTTYHAQPTATNIKTEVPPSPYGRGAGGEGNPATGQSGQRQTTLS